MSLLTTDHGKQEESQVSDLILSNFEDDHMVFEVAARKPHQDASLFTQESFDILSSSLEGLGLCRVLRHKRKAHPYFHVFPITREDTFNGL